MLAHSVRWDEDHASDLSHYISKLVLNVFKIIPSLHQENTAKFSCTSIASDLFVFPFALFLAAFRRPPRSPNLLLKRLDYTPQHPLRFLPVAPCLREGTFMSTVATPPLPSRTSVQSLSSKICCRYSAQLCETTFHMFSFLFRVLSKIPFTSAETPSTGQD